jgi:plastocyanin
MKRTLYSLLPFVIFLLFASSFAKAVTHTITAADFQFTPDTMTIAAGDTVTWLWEGGIHTTTANGIPAGAAQWNALLDSAHTGFSYVATVPGVYHYISVPDLPTMTGTFTIPGAVVGIAETYLSPFTFDLVSNLVHSEVAITYTMHSTTSVEVALYNISGMRLQTFLKETMPAGNYHDSFSITATLPAGMYLVRMQGGAMAVTRRLVIQ